MAEQDFHLPDVGEGLTEADIVSWGVAPGDTVALNQVVCEIETAKSLVELPSPFEGVVVELLAEVGETVPVGQPILRVRVAGDHEDQGQADEGVDPSVSATEAPHSTEPATTEASSDEGGGAVLVGYGSAGPTTSRRGRRRAVLEPTDRSLETEPTAVDDARRQAIPPRGGASVLATPPTRKLAKDHGIDLRDVVGSGSLGQVRRDDVMKHVAAAEQVTSAHSAPQRAAEGWPAEREERIPVKGVRKQIAKAMSESARTAPHVSVFVDVDATRTMEFVQRLKTSQDFAGVKVSPLLIVARAVIWAIRRNPMVNSTFTDSEITVHNYVNLGLAAATPRGLVVPNIKDAHELSLVDLARAIESLTNTAREGRTQPAEMAGGTMTITNFGIFGIDSGTPIINPGEAGIIGMGAIRKKPWVVDDRVVPRWVTTVGGSFDHRVVDGDVISRFVADVASVLEEPALLLD